MNTAWAAAAMAAAAVPLAYVAAGPLGLPMVENGVASLLLSLGLAPIVEEWVLRAGVQVGVERALQRRGARGRWPGFVALSVGTLAFAFIHLRSFSADSLLQCLPWLVPGLALAALWHWRRRLHECMLMHAWFNLSLWLFSG